MLVPYFFNLHRNILRYSDSEMITFLYNIQQQLCFFEHIDNLCILFIISSIKILDSLYIILSHLKYQDY